MKKYLFILLISFSGTAIAQDGLGIKGGLNYADNGEITFADVSDAGKDVVKGGERKAGYHLGIFYHANLGPVFLRPELLYTTTKSSYNYNQKKAEYEVSKIDLPILLGMNIIGPVNIFAGPSLQYIMDHNYEGFELEDVKDEFTVGAQVGAGVQFGKLGIDVRYERALQENEAKFLSLDGSSNGPQRVDTRPSQIIFSLSLDI